MHSSLFLRLFPPPKFMVMKHAGLQISDDALRCLELHQHNGRIVLGKYGEKDLPPGTIEGGEIKDDKALISTLKEFDAAHGLSYVKVSIPEEKSYLFQTDVPSADVRTVAQNIEFKLEENVPLAAVDALYYFELMAPGPNGIRASVSVVPRAYIENISSIIKSVGLEPVAFEVVPRAVARAVCLPNQHTTEMVVYIMNKKTGIYVVVDGVVSFTSTFGWGSLTVASEDTPDMTALIREINRIYTYWTSHGQGGTMISRIVLVGRSASTYAESLRQAVTESGMVVAVANVWQNIFDVNRYVPTIEERDSLDYAAAIGLAMDL